jgi:hypothetical protein
MAVAAEDSIQCVERQCKVEVVDAMPLVAGRGVMLLGGDGGVKLPREDDGAMPLRGAICVILLESVHVWWCDTIVIEDVGLRPTTMVLYQKRLV